MENWTSNGQRGSGHAPRLLSISRAVSSGAFCTRWAQAGGLTALWPSPSCLAMSTGQRERLKAGECYIDMGLYYKHQIVMRDKRGLC